VLEAYGYVVAQEAYLHDGYEQMKRWQYKVDEKLGRVAFSSLFDDGISRKVWG
jgi:hypothetical protein